VRPAEARTARRGRRLRPTARPRLEDAGHFRRLRRLDSPTGSGRHCSTCGWFLCGLGRLGRWRIGRHAPYPRDRRHHGGLLIDRRQEVCKQMTTAPTPDALRDALRGVTDPASGKDIVTAGLVEGIELRGGLVQVALLT